MELMVDVGVWKLERGLRGEVEGAAAAAQWLVGETNSAIGDAGEGEEGYADAIILDLYETDKTCSDGSLVESSRRQRDICHGMSGEAGRSGRVGPEGRREMWNADGGGRTLETDRIGMPRSVAQQIRAVRDGERTMRWSRMKR